MAPNKFVAPLRKNGVESFSFSSNISSNGSLTISPEVISSSQPLVTTVQATPLPADNNAQKLGEPALVSGSQEPSKQSKKRPMFQGPSQVAPTTNSQDPPVKKQKRDNKTESSVSENSPPALCDDDDKENQKPLKLKKKETEDKRPFKSLTEQEYDLIFQAVLSKYQSDEDGESSNQKADPIEHANESFELSQSDIEDDSEDKNGKSTKECSSKSNLKITSKNDANAPEIPQILDPKIVDKQPLLPEATSIQNDSESSQSQISQVAGQDDSQITGVPESPCITYICHPSQPDPDRGVTQSKSPSRLEDVLDNSQGLTAVKSNICLENFVTPQKTANKKSSIMNCNVSPVKDNSTPTLSSSQDLPSTPIVKTSIQSSQSLRTPLSTASRTSSTMQSSQRMQGPKSPFATPQKSLLGSLVESSQEPLTPKCMPYQQSSVTGTPQSALLKVSSPVPSTPRGSQQLSQELQHTPPPKGLSARERLKWLQEKRVTGVWVQCDETSCGKWRFLPDCHDPSTLPKIWKCSMHPDETLNHCDAAEKRLNLLEEEDMIFNKYSPGSLVWAKLSGYPWWPAMVEDDPDLEMFYWLNLFSDIPTWYHVVFFDDVNRPRTRAWVQVERLQSFESRPIDEDLSPELVGYKRRVSAAVKIANTARSMSMKDRLDRFSFAVSYKGPIGGPSKKKYQGPIGLREAITE